MNRTLLMLAGALLVAGAALFVLYRDAYVLEATGGERVLVVTAARDIPFGAPMDASWLSTKEVPRDYYEDRHLPATELRAIIGTPLAQSVRSGEAILRTDLSISSDRQRTLSTAIPSGMRAVNLAAQPASTQAGLLRPGDRVDVLCTVSNRREVLEGQTVVVAQNLLVLSVGHEVQWRRPENANQPAGRSTQVTVQADLPATQRLVLARRQGQIRLVMRNANDGTQIESPRAVTMGNLLDRVRRSDWLRRFALVERPTIPAGGPGDASDVADDDE